jgi:uncharacterized protein YndB with AHSA1/START domain
MSNNNRLEIKVGLVMQRSAHEVFEAIVDPAQMKNYFITESSGRMEEGKSLNWKFPEMDMQFPVQVRKVEMDKYVSYSWKDPAGKETIVEMSLTPKPGNSTFVSITEKDQQNNEEGLKWLKSNTEGWANFLACLKAWIEYGINLRKGAFDPSQMQ